MLTCVRRMTRSWPFCEGISLTGEWQGVWAVLWMHIDRSIALPHNADRNRPILARALCQSFCFEAM